MRAARVLSFGLVALLPACGALLDLPDPTVDAGVGASGGDSGFYPDGGPIGDGSQGGGDGSQGGDGSTGSDGSTDIDSGPPCGPEMKNCHGGECFNNQCLPTPVTTALIDPIALASDGTSLYVISTTSNIYRVDLSDPGTTHAIVTGEPQLNRLSVNGGYVFFVSNGAEGWASRCPTTGCPGGRTDYVGGAAHSVFDIVSDGTNVYYSFDDSSGGGVFGFDVNKSGSQFTVKGIANARLLQLDGTSLYFSAGVGDNGVYECAVGSCGTPAHNESSSVHAITHDGTNVYYVTDSSIFTQAKGSDTAVQASISTSGNVAIGVDNQYIYWLAKNGGTGILSRCTISGPCSSPAPVVSSLNDPSDMIVVGDTIFYATITDHTIWRVTK